MAGEQATPAAVQDPYGPGPFHPGARVRCRKCGDVIQSKSRHDFKWCECHAIAVDGGTDYLRLVGDPRDVQILNESDSESAILERAPLTADELAAMRQRRGAEWQPGTLHLQAGETALLAARYDRARTDIARLLAEVERLREEKAQWFKDLFTHERNEAHRHAELTAAIAHVQRQGQELASTARALKAENDRLQRENASLRYAQFTPNQREALFAVLGCMEEGSGAPHMYANCSRGMAQELINKLRVLVPSVRGEG